MKQTAPDLNLSLSLSLKKTRKREFLEQMEQVVTWGSLVELIVPYLSRGQEWQATLFPRDDAA